MSNYTSKSSVLNEVLAANQKYVGGFADKGSLALPPARKFAILSCMDARLDPAKFAGLREGDAHVLRNAGGRVTEDVIRSLVISHKLLGTKEWFIIHHTDCGAGYFTDEVIRGLLTTSLKTATFDGKDWKNTDEEGGSDDGHGIAFMPIRDLNISIIADVKKIRNHPLVSKDVLIYGYIYDVKTGALTEVPEATKIGAPEAAEIGAAI